MPDEYDPIAGADKIMKLLKRNAEASGVTLEEYIRWWLGSDDEEDDVGGSNAG